MPVLLDKFCIFKIIFKVGHLLDDLPFALLLGMILTIRVAVRVESKGLWRRLSLSLLLISSEYSTLPSTSATGIPAGRT